ncbi:MULTISPECIES: aldehyde dehydrogenase family protein [Pantoea]|uniref:Aldehyde dehydrogenase family protein n=1 Tax=Candidatus Pantoea multigeneris TaxID=2608357 RepID=A0ABX0R842_9GAMM|nr:MULTISPECIES: aldehyde dehydrogenase family protein [Pantoea]NIF21533.1 aldehyde dehydrogenase family protein [Pantoea multigeneris]
MESYKSFIGGKWVGTEATTHNVNPSDTKDLLGLAAQSGIEHVNQAVAAAREAFPAWSTSPIQLRSRILDVTGNEILARRDELGRLLASEEGKTLREATGEVIRAGEIFKFMAGEALRIPGEVLDSTRPGMTVEITREAVGVIGMITPWNFPIAIPAWKTAPALAFGNCVVIKPAELVPASAQVLADILHRAGLPDGVFNLVLGKGSVVGQALIEHPGIDAISFTGSQGVGENIAQIAASRMIRCQLEMGGKNPLVVMDDADIDIAVECALDGSFFATGQRCTASSRLIVQSGIHDQFVERLVSRMKAINVGHALDPQTHIGPVVDLRQLESNFSHVHSARAEGAELIYGGERLDLATPGFYMSPALLIATHNDMKINQDEVFGPVASVIPAADFDEALAIANNTRFGLSSGIVTRSLKHAAAFKRHSQAGMVMVNAPTAGVDPHVPFGGRKASSFGPREQGRYAIEFYTSVKTSYIQP